MKDPKVKKRKLKYSGEKSTKELLFLKDELENLPGMIKIEFDLLNQNILLQYDLKQMQLDLVEKKMAERGFQLSKRRFQRFKRGWIKYTETNEKENLMTIPRPCCHIPRHYYFEKKGDRNS